MHPYVCFVHRFSSADQWGVMHDGKTAYPGAVDCIDRLGQAGKKIVRVHLVDGYCCRCSLTIPVQQKQFLLLTILHSAGMVS